MNKSKMIESGEKERDPATHIIMYELIHRRCLKIIVD